MSNAIPVLVKELIPPSPEIGLYPVPNIPAKKLDNALRDYAETVRAEEVLAVYDATLRGNAKDGAVFTADRMVFQNNDLTPPQEVRYEDIVRVTTKKKFIGGRKVYVDANRGRATVTFVVDFSGRPKAAEFVARFLHEAMHATIVSQDTVDDATTDMEAVTKALQALHRKGSLSRSDMDAMIAAVE